MSFKKFLFFLNLILPWQPNKIAIGHKKYKLGKHSSNDHNCQTWFTSLHVFGENAINLPFSQYKSMGAFCCHGNQTKRQITKKFGYFQRTLTKQHSFQVRYKSLQWLWRSCHFKVLTDRQPNMFQQFGFRGYVPL